MHNQDLIAQEDTVFVLKEHRNGIGRKLIQAVHEELKQRGVKRLNITTATDLRVSKLLLRMGYKHTAHAMTISL
jgi:GNAT superfamily N-acetyltransferase